MATKAGQLAVTPRVVFDCMVFLQGAARPAGPAAACLRLVDEGRLILCVSDEVLAELRDVLTRPKTQQRFAELSLEWVGSFVQSIILEPAAFLQQMAGQGQE